MVFVHRQKYLKENKIEILAYWSIGDVIDNFPKGELQYDNKPNLDIVPKKDLVRVYMRYKALKPAYEKYKPKRGIYDIKIIILKINCRKLCLWD